MTKPYHFAVIGCGGISRVHIEQISQIPHAKLVAVSDIIETNARAVGDRVGVDWYTDYHELLKRSDIDIVNIVTPSGTHAEIVVDAARAGKHIIVEKPIDTTVEKAEWAISECRKAGVKLSVVSQHRFDDSTMRVKNEMMTGKFGKLVLAQASVHWYRSQAYFERSPGSGTWAMDGGGVLMIQALHTLDVLQHLVGPISTVYSHVNTATHPGIEVEDVAATTVTFDNGAVGTISATTSAYPRNSTRLEIFGELGSAVVENDHLTHLYFRTPDEPGQMFGGDALNWADGLKHNEKQVAHRRQFEDMIEAVHHNREPLVNGEESMKVLRLILAMYESARTNTPISLSKF
ncbi:Gfo/Idh/MocA family oxidoreductase [Alicyclobacillus fastidiosus]|uniref:Gfo/Idh/MocA family oxidoreductase n=1 Tax=Alicyclobacillus fastidiosus TaxID=392011 RepID=A0ABY6ZCI9_9BACL|nr:Gfo/Idh/MocA family oxidoreductase [Alicyclobacillus fastidiosus]WAH40576.1 Gfo/Idh/MocA family oxidoreductase [Alicyclobacillus fastidiosus]GMA62011.1 oxidoreductase [Alicyclobacillus fastidiosus]